MESFFIWGATLLIAIVIVTPYLLKYRRLQKRDEQRKQKAQRLGADKAIAQYPHIDTLLCIGCGSCVQACPEGGVLGIVDGQATIINGLKCVGHGMCAEACPVGAIQVGLGDIQKRDDIPLLSEHYETNIPGLFIAGELGGLALIRNAIAQGKAVVDYIASNTRHKANDEILDIVIIGAGPAGLSASLAAKQHGLSFVTVDRQEAGGTILHYPKKKLVLTRPVEIPLYGTLSKKEYLKEELLSIWQDMQKTYKLPIRTNNKLKDIRKHDEIFEVICEKESYQSRHVILAMGRRGTPRKLNVPGEDSSKVMYRLLDAVTYQHNNILIVGGGDSAVEAAIGLAQQAGNTITISYRKDTFFRIKKRNEERLRPLVASGKIQILFNSHVHEIRRDSVVVKTEAGLQTLPNDYVFIFIGGEPPLEPLKKIGIRFGGSAN